MKYLTQFFIIVLFTYAGESITTLFSLPIPGPMIGIVLLFFALSLNVVKISQVKEVGDWLKSNLALFFVPATVALMTYFDVIKGNVVSIVTITFFSTLLTLLISAFTANIFVKKEHLND